MTNNGSESSFFTALEYGTSGSFNHLDWTINIDESSSMHYNTLVSIHEHLHDHFNQTTSNGWLLIVYSYLARETGEPLYHDLLMYLVHRCRNVHEIGATCNSVLTIAATSGINCPERLLNGNSQYLSYYNQGMSLIQGVESLSLKKVAIISIVNVCLQTPTVLKEAQQSLEAFDPRGISNSHFPDARLLFLSKHLTQDFWKAILDNFKKNHSDNKVLQKVLRDIPPTEKLDDAYTFLEIEFNELVESTLCKFLKENNQDHTLFNNSLDGLESLIEKALSIWPSQKAKKPIRFNTNHEDIQLDLLRSMEQEKLSYSDVRVRYEFFCLDDMAENEWLHLHNGNSDEKYFSVISRAGERILLNSSFTNKTSYPIKNLLAVPMTCLCQKAVDEQGILVKLFWIRDVTVFERLKQVVDSIPIYSNTSMLLVSSEKWNEQWQTSLDNCHHHSILFDLLPGHQLTRIASQFDQFFFQKVQVKCGTSMRITLILVGLINNRHFYFLVPCSETIANTIINFLRLRVGDAQEDKMIVEAYKNEIRISLIDLYSFETTFDFDALNTQLGRIITQS